MEEPPKAKFSDIMGGLVASVAYGRNVADVQALRIATQYRKNDLLRGLPVPRLRLSKVTISLPLIVSEVLPGSQPEWGAATEIAKSTADALIKSTKELYESVNESSKQENLTTKEGEFYGRLKRLLYYMEPDMLTLSETHSDSDEFIKPSDASSGAKSLVKIFQDLLRNQLEGAFRQLWFASGGAFPSDASIRDTAADAAEQVLTVVAEELNYRYTKDRVAFEKKKDAAKEDFDADWARKSTAEIIDHPLFKQLVRDVRIVAEERAIIKPTVPPDFLVTVDTDSIKNAGGGPDTVTRLNMVLMEEGLEWLSESVEGKQVSRLMPE